MSDALPFGKDAKPDLGKPGPRVPLTKFEFATKFLEQDGRWLSSAQVQTPRVIPLERGMGSEFCSFQITGVISLEGKGTRYV